MNELVLFLPLYLKMLR